MTSEPGFTPSERLILAGLHASTICELVEEFMDTDGVITREGARHLWQKFFLASAGHSLADHLATMEKVWAHLGKRRHQADPALEDSSLEAALDRAFERGERLAELLLAEPMTPAELCLTMATLTRQVAEALEPHDGPV